VSEQTDSVPSPRSQDPAPFDSLDSVFIVGEGIGGTHAPRPAPPSVKKLLAAERDKIARWEQYKKSLEGQSDQPPA
jgi:hypothetical protein